MTAPITIYRPKVWIQPLDEAGAPDGADTDVSCDLMSIELTPEVPIDNVTTFCGSYQTVGEVEVSATLEVAVGADTDDRWSPLVGRRVEVRVWDRDEATEYRSFESQVTINPSLYGPTTPGEVRSHSFDIPVTSAVIWETGVAS